MSNEKNLSADELAAVVAKLQAELAELKAAQPVPEEDLVVIAATACAFLGLKGKVKAIQFAGRATNTLPSA